jgi:adenosylcobinamide kinase/adenosylcobinamide-phosphate guanylyltransferase
MSSLKARTIIQSLSHVTLVLGGARSGKSRYAETCITKAPSPWVYVATGQAYDDEMKARIAEHQSHRAQGWQTIEAPVDLASAIAEAGESPILIDCLTLWLTNLMLGEHDIETAIARFEGALAQCTAPIFLVSNEVGLGIVPNSSLGRRFRDEAGKLNQRVAARAGRVLFMVAGLPMTLK